VFKKLQSDMYSYLMCLK